MADIGDTHRAELIGESDCPTGCGGTATTWWEVPIDPDLGDEVYRVSCPNCKHTETW